LVPTLTMRRARRRGIATGPEDLPAATRHSTQDGAAGAAPRQGCMRWKWRRTHYVIEKTYVVTAKGVIGSRRQAGMKGFTGQFIRVAEGLFTVGLFSITLGLSLAAGGNELGAQRLARVPREADRGWIQ
jgi:hypothetical protein